MSRWFTSRTGQRSPLAVVGVPPAPATYAAAVAADTPLSWWRMDDAGTTMADAVGGRNGTYAGSPASVAAMRAGSTGGKRFDGVNDRSDVTTGALAFTGTAPFTIEMLIRLPVVIPTGFPVIAYTGAGWSVEGGAAGSTSVWLTRGATVTVILTVNTVHHVAWTYDGTTIRAYKDGSEVATGTSATAMTTMTALTVGSAPWGAQWFSGDLSDFAIYDKALSAGRVAAHHAARNVT